MVKRLLLQLLENIIGDKEFILDLAAAYRVSMTNDPTKIEKMMWECLDTALKRFQGNNHVMIIADGLDEVQGGEKVAKAIVDRLGSISAEYLNIQVITMSHLASLKPNKGRTHSFAISADHTYEDLRMVIDHSLEDYKYFKSRSEHARENLVEQLLQPAKGNFLWAILTAALAKRETSEEGFLKIVKAAKEATWTLDATIAKLTNTVDFGKSDAGLLMSLILVANRPLTTLELKHLLQIDLTRRQTQERKTDIKHDLRAYFGDLIVVRNDFIRLCHSTVRSHLLQIQAEGKKLRSRQAVQSDMAARLLAYGNFSLPMTGDPVFDLEKVDIHKLFAAHGLLEYAVRNWTVHFQSSAMYHRPDSFQLTDEFKAVFPSTTQLALLEWGCWKSETFHTESIRTLDLALQVRQAVLSDKHVCTLQSLIVCGSVWRETTHTTEAADCFYRAATIGRQILSNYHAVIASCTTAFLTITDSVVVTTRTEIVTRREEMLIYTIDMYKYQHGKTHDLVIRYYKLLAQLYVNIREEHKAETIWRELREIVITRFGKGSQEEISMYVFPDPHCSLLYPYSSWERCLESPLLEKPVWQLKAYPRVETLTSKSLTDRKASPLSSRKAIRKPT